jgi:glucose/arabinose dehydrogenase
MRIPATVRQLLRLTLGLLLLLSALGSAPPKTTAISLATVPPGFTDIQIASVGGPTAIAFTPDNRMLVTTQGGQLRLYNLNGSLISTALDFNTQWPVRRICSDFERGLLGVAVDPNFAANNQIYLYYTAVVTPTAFTNCDSGAGRNSPNVVNRVSRFTLTGSTVPTTTEQILVDNIRSLNGNHNGGDLNFGKDGLLYISVGESGTGGALARSRNTLNGKILRVNPDGTPAAGNPWIAEGGSRRCGTPGPQNYPASGNCREIFSYGLRNPFRFAMDPTTSGSIVRFFINDVGQSTWEEVDLGQAGVDYGWNVREGPCPAGQSCTPPNPSVYTDPIDWYNHSIGCSYVTGGAFVPANVWPNYDGSYLFADGGCGRAFRLVPNGSGGYTRAGSDFATGLGEVRHFEFGPYQSGQALYYANASAVRRIAMNNSAPTAMIAANPRYGPVPLTVNFSAAGSSDPNGDPLTYEWDFGDTQTANTTTSTTSHNYQSAGVYTATLVVRDNNTLGSAPVSIQIQAGNTPPSPSISQPGSGVTFAVGDIINLAGSATDAEPASLPVTLRWDVWLWHVDAVNPGNAHHHTLVTINGGTGQFTAPAPEDFNASDLSYVEVRLTATDAWGLSDVVTRTLQPRRVQVTFATQPSGLRVTVNGFNATGSQTLTAWEKWALNVAAPGIQTQGANAWAFDHWEDNSTSAARSITTPATNTTYTATFIPGKRVHLPVVQK